MPDFFLYSDQLFIEHIQTSIIFSGEYMIIIMPQAAAWEILKNLNCFIGGDIEQMNAAGSVTAGDG